MSRHTKGPWTFDDATGFVWGGPGSILAQTWSKHENDYPNAKANGRLIALAPELYDLAAYVALHHCQHPDEPDTCHFCAARAIVRKVTEAP